MDSGVFVAFTGVAPVENVHRAVGAVTEVDAAEPRISGVQHVWLMLADEARAFSFELLDVHSPTVQVERQQTTAILRGPVVAEIDRRSAVSVPAAEPVMFTSHLARVGPVLAGVPVIVVGVAKLFSFEQKDMLRFASEELKDVDVSARFNA